MEYQKKWYDNKLLVYLLLLILFPLGLYALWKSRTINKWLKVSLSLIIITLGVLLGVNERVVEEKSVNQIAVDYDSDCSFRLVEIKAFKVGTDELLEERTLDGCFKKKVVDQSLGLVEVSNSDGNIKVSYYIEDDPKVLRFLDVKLGEGESSHWRANKGHDLFIIEKDGNLNFIFGDRKRSKIKGTIRFLK